MPETTLISKLGIKPGMKLLILNAPDGFTKELEPLPVGTTLAVRPEGEGIYDFVQLFVYHKADADSHALNAIKALKPGGILYYAYPKGTGKIKTDINRDSGWDAVNQIGWRPVRAISIDETWSGLRFRPEADVKPKR